MALEEIPPNFDTLFLQQIGEQKQLLEHALLSGGAGSYDEYKNMVGQYRGLCVAENTFKDLVQAWENR